MESKDRLRFRRILFRLRCALASAHCLSIDSSTTADSLAREKRAFAWHDVLKIVFFPECVPVVCAEFFDALNDIVRNNGAISTEANA